MAIVVPVMVYEVIARYGFNAPTVWAMELAVLLFGPYFLLGGPYLLHLHGHVALDVVRQRLSTEWNRGSTSELPGDHRFLRHPALLSVPAAYSALQYRETSFSAWNPPIWPAKLVVPLALLLMMLQALAEMARLVYGRTPETHTPVEAGIVE